MRIAIDSLVAHSRPDLIPSLIRFDSTVAVEVLDPFLPPADIITEIARLRPDIVIIDPAWLVISLLFMRVLQLGGHGNARTVIGTRGLDNVTRVRVAHGGFFDVLDLDQESGALVSNIARISEGHSSLDGSRLWHLVARPPALTDVSGAPEDATDLAILELIAIGLPDPEVAEVVHLSRQTVRNRVSGMLRRVGMSNRRQMAWTYTNQVLVDRMITHIEARRWTT